MYINQENNYTNVKDKSEIQYTVSAVEEKCYSSSGPFDNKEKAITAGEANRTQWINSHVVNDSSLRAKAIVALKVETKPYESSSADDDLGDPFEDSFSEDFEL